MSYSFTVVASSKAAAKDDAVRKFAEIVQQQPVHARDAHQAMAVVFAFIDLCDEDAGKHYSVSVHGSLGVSALSVSSANVGVGVYLVSPETK